MEMVKHQNEDQEKTTKKKRSRGMHVIRIVLYMLRRRRRKPFKLGFWRRLVESVGQLNKAPADITIMPPPEKDGDVEKLSETVEALTATSSSSPSGISGYGSAMSLRDLEYPYYHGDDDDDDDDDDDGDGCYGHDDEGDCMIDVKAEEFIANFYAKIRMQNQAYAERCEANWA